MSVPNFSSATWTHKPTQSTESSSPQISYIVTLCCGSAFPKFWSLKWLLVAMLTFRFRTLDTNSTRSISSWVKVLNAKFLLGEAFFLPGGQNVQPRRVGGVCTCQESYSGWMIPLTLLVCVDRVLRELGSPERSWLQHWSSQRTGKWPNMACQLFLCFESLMYYLRLLLHYKGRPSLVVAHKAWNIYYLAPYRKKKKIDSLWPIL